MAYDSVKEKVCNQIFEALKERFSTNPMLQPIKIQEDYPEVLLREYREYYERIQLQRKGMMFHCGVTSPELKSLLANSDYQKRYEEIGFIWKLKDTKNSGIFAEKTYEESWTTGELSPETLQKIGDDFEAVVQISESFKNLLHVKLQSSKSEKSKRKDCPKSEPRNLIYFGAPGTGKSHQLNEEAETKFGKNFERVTFYPTYSYQQFVGSYKPFVSETGNITYRFVFGPLMRLLLKAWEAEEAYQVALEDLEALDSADEKDKDHAAINAAKAQVKANRFVLVVEELNRAEAAAVFGDIFQLLDRDENGESEYEISPSEELRLALGWDENKKLYFPSNFYIWATMNNADQGVMPLDTAFKRRWEFEYVDLDNGADKLNAKASKENLWNKLRKNINAGLRKLAVNEDKLLGPFFMKAKGLTEEKAFWKTFCDKVVLYLYEDAARLRRKECFKGSNITYSDLRKKLVTEFKDWEKCKTTLEDVFSFEITNTISEKDWPWPPQAKDGPTGNETDDKPLVEDSGAQGESTSDNH